MGNTGAVGPSKTAALLIASTMTVMAGATIAPSLPGMTEVFAQTSGAALRVRLVLTITALAIAIAAPFAGIIGDRIGRVKVLGGAVLLYVLAGSAGLYLNDLSALLGSRILLGIAVAGVMTATTALIGDLYQGPARGRMLGLQGAAAGFGGVVFLGLGGLLAEQGWRGPFLIYLMPIALLVLIPIAFRGNGTMIPAVRADEPAGIAPLGKLALVYLLAFFGMVSFYAVPVQLPFLLGERGLPDPSVSGGALAGMSLVSALVGVGYARLTRDLAFGSVAILAFGFMAAGMLAIAVLPAFIATVLALALIGVGMGLLVPTLSGWLLSLSPPSLRGRVMGGFASAVFLGQFASPLILQPAIAAGGLEAAFIAAGGITGVLAILLVVLKSRAPSVA